MPPRKFAFSRKSIDSLKVKAAEYITEKFANFVQNAGQATKIIVEAVKKKVQKMIQKNKKNQMKKEQSGGYQTCLDKKLLAMSYFLLATSTKTLLQIPKGMLQPNFFSVLFLR